MKRLFPRKLGTKDGLRLTEASFEAHKRGFKSHLISGSGATIQWYRGDFYSVGRFGAESKTVTLSISPNICPRTPKYLGCALLSDTDPLIW